MKVKDVRRRRDLREFLDENMKNFYYLIKNNAGLKNDSLWKMNEKEFSLEGVQFEETDIFIGGRILCDEFLYQIS